ncbi:MAG: TrkH family potassium uptake protein [Burkholderiales bacterium]
MFTLLAVLHVLGLTVLLFGATMLVPLMVAWVGSDAALLAYDESILITMASGFVVWWGTRRYKRELQPRDGFLLVSLTWTTLPAFATLPLLFYFQQNGTPLSFTDAYFETVSGLTTSGATVLTGLEHLPASINVWRHFLVWLGGMGILVLAVAILPLLGVGGSQIYKAETPGPMKESKLTPRIAETAKGLYAVYFAITLACIAAFKLAGMNWLDAVCHAFSTMGLGGFSTYDASFGAFAAHPAVDWVAVTFMLLASINFSMHFLAWRRKSLSPYWACPEARFVLLALVGSALFISIYLYQRGVYSDLGDALRYGVFNTVSIASTTGFANTDYEQWPIFVPVLMIFLSCFATSSGSTGGGIKMIRALVLLQQAGRELSRALHPKQINPVRLGRDAIDNKVVFAIMAFMLMYGMTIIIATFLLLLSGLDEKSAFTAVMACINNMGPGLGQVGPASNYQGLSDFQTWVCTLIMLLGRLELFTLLVLFTPAFWRK